MKDLTKHKEVLKERQAMITELWNNANDYESNKENSTLQFFIDLANSIEAIKDSGLVGDREELIYALIGLSGEINSAKDGKEEDVIFEKYADKFHHETILRIAKNLSIIQYRIKATMDKEASRNNGSKAIDIHSYSEICSCGRCHLSGLITEAIREAILEENLKWI